MNQLRQEILSLLKKQNNTFWGALNSVNASTKELLEELNSLHKEKIISTEKEKIFLTQKGIKLTKTFLEPIEWNSESEKKLLEKFLEATKNRPEASQKFDQGSITPKDSVSRAMTIGKNSDVDSKKILIIGDDDLTSIALALTERTKEILVLEIDERINSFINEFAEKNSFNLKAIEWNVEKDLPKNLQKEFDVFLTDPVETLDGIKMFLGRGMQALKGKDSAFYFGLTRIDAGKNKWLEIQKMILNSGFIFTEIIKDQGHYPFNQFTGYKGGINNIPKEKTLFEIPSAKQDFFKSNFIRCLAVKKITPLVKGKISLKKNWYLDKEIF